MKRASHHRLLFGTSSSWMRTHFWIILVWFWFAFPFDWLPGNHHGTCDRLWLANAYHSLPALTPNEPNTLCNDVHCLHGICHDGECICERGWKGKLCHICGGRLLLNNTSGFISDGGKNYTSDQQCTWLIDGRQYGNQSVIRLKFIEFETECNWDHLYVFKGDSLFAPLVAAFSGVLMRTGRNQIGFRLPEIDIEGGLVYLYFYSDTAYYMDGFNLSYQVIPCPGNKCINHHSTTAHHHHHHRDQSGTSLLGNSIRDTILPASLSSATSVSFNEALNSEFEINHCSAQDANQRNQSNCNCNDGLNNWRCLNAYCPNKCSLHGECDSDTRTCVCNDGYAGADCGQIKVEGYWQALNHLKKQTILGRALHQSVVLYDHMYVIGGEFFDITYASDQFVMQFNLITSQWTNVSNPLHESMHRFGHTVVEYHDNLYMYGGLRPDGSVVSDFWNYSTVTSQWNEIPNTNRNHNCSIRMCAPLPMVGHSANIVGDHMYIIFGYNSKYGYLNTIQQYNFKSNTWSLLNPSGALVRGGFGHSSVYHAQTDMIYVYGGHHSAGSDSVLVDHLYGYNLESNKWILLTPSQSPRYFHTASIINDQMYIYGGNAHNATNDGAGSQCFSTQFLVYNIPCDSWHFLSEPSDVILNNIGTGRFGHSSVVYQNHMYIFGGFNGIMLNTMFKYTPANCSSVHAKHDCFKMRFSMNCMWNEDSATCEQMHLHFKRSVEMVDPQPTANTTSTALIPSNSHFLHLWAKHKCPIKHVNYNELCEKQTNCPTCLDNSYGCVWCEDSCQHEKCRSKSIMTGLMQNITVVRHPDQCDADDENTLMFNCEKFHNCYSCYTDNYCSWNNEQKCKQYVVKYSNKTQKAITPDSSRTFCEPLCQLHTSCENCTLNQCMWCSSLNRCIESNAYSAIFPLAQCMEWTIKPERCSNMTCEYINSCELCHQNPSCGWCDDGTNTGAGKCMRGSSTGPLIASLSKSYSYMNHTPSAPLNGHYSSRNKFLDNFYMGRPHSANSILYNSLDKYLKGMDRMSLEQCPSHRWYFTSCPDCQCNGHSQCLRKNNKTVCEQPCKDLTEGELCDKCTQGYFGHPINGASCKKCLCNNHSDICNSRTGRCVCNTKGVVGHYCDKCDEVNFYHGNPVDGTCFYNLSIDFQYTFNMSKFEDRFYKHINFMNVPPKPDMDVDFTISCSVTAYFNISIGSHTLPIRTLHENHLCTNTRFRFSHDEQLFGIENTSFYVYVSSFSFPFLLQISFSQHRSLDLLQFFVTFCSCFLTLLVIAAVFWKIKQKYDLYRRRQQLFLELEHLASRPFSAIIVYLPEENKTTNPELNDHNDSVGRLANIRDKPELPGKTGEGDVLPLIHSKLSESNGKGLGKIIEDPENPTPIALEPCYRNRAAVLSLILRMPTGGTGEVPIGQTGVAIASTLVTLGPGAHKVIKNNSFSRKNGSNSSNENNAPVFL